MNNLRKRMNAQIQSIVEIIKVGRGVAESTQDASYLPAKAIHTFVNKPYIQQISLSVITPPAAAFGRWQAGL